MKNQTMRVYLLQDDGTFPNHPRWPLLVYPAALTLTAPDPVAATERLFRRNGWGGTWRNGIYRYHHFHSNNHEVLGVVSGSARAQFGGPKGVEIELKAGDVAVLPAGTAHKNLGSTDDLVVIGAYPPGPAYDVCRGTPEERPRAIKNVKRVPKPAGDPVFGTKGGLCSQWAE